MKHLVLSLACLQLLLGYSSPDEDKKASVPVVTSDQLLQYDDVTHRVLLNRAVLDKLSSLQGPLHVMTAIGDARIGKSTALNVMTAMLTTKDKKGKVHSVPPVFSVCESLETCTKGVWMHTLPLQQGGHMVMLDVEGTDLGGDLITTQFSLLTSYLSADVLIFLKESVPKRAAIFLHELARLKERLKLHTSDVYTSQMLYVVIRDPLKPPEDMSLKSYVSQTLTNPSHCIDAPEECKLLEKYFPLTKVNVYSLPYVSRRHQKSLEWTLKDKAYLRTLSSLTFDLKSAIDSNTETSSQGQVFSGIIRTFMRTLQPNMVSSPQAGGSNGVCEPGDKTCQETTEIDTTTSTDTNGKTAVNTDQSVSGEQLTATGPQKIGSIDIEKIIKSPFETMGPGVYSFVMDNIKRLRPSSPSSKTESNDQDDDSDSDDDCKDLDGLSCDSRKSKGAPVSKWAKAVRDFIDDIADALDDFFSSVMYE